MNLGKYEILNEIGKGGFGTVYRARDAVLGRELALKVLKPAWIDDARAVEMFHREARAAARLEHPNIVDVFDMGEIDGRLFIAMRLIDGEPLNARIKRLGQQSLADALPVIADIASALDLAHRNGITHRDIKPSNILIRKDGRGLLTDFGLVRGGEQASFMVTSSPGVVVGTAEYIAPEIWKNELPSAASDVYALACVVFEMLTGVVLYAWNSTPAVIHRHLSPPDLSRIEDPAVARILTGALGADPKARPGATELVAQLRSLASGAPAPDPEQARLRDALKRASEGARWAEAREAATRLLALIPNDPSAAEGLAVAQRELDALEARIAAVAEARRRLSVALEGREWDEAERRVAELRSYVPNDSEAGAALDRIEQERRKDAAERQQREAHIAALRNRVTDRFAAGRWAELERDAGELLALVPGDAQAQAALHSARIGYKIDGLRRQLAAAQARGDWPLVQRHANEILANIPDDPSARAALEKLEASTLHPNPAATGGWTIPLVVAGLIIAVACLLTWALPLLFGLGATALGNARSTTVSVAAASDWQDSGLRAKAGDSIQIDYVSGRWSPWPTAQATLDGRGCLPSLCPAELLNSNSPLNLLVGAHGAMIASVGNNAYVAGNSVTFVAGEAGPVLLRINDRALADNAGALQVRVSIR